MLWTKRMLKLLYVKCGITNSHNDQTERIEHFFSLLSSNALTLQVSNREDTKAVHWFSCADKSLHYKNYKTQWWQEIFIFVECMKFHFFRSLLLVEPGAKDLIKLIDQALQKLQFGIHTPHATQLVFVRARILALQLSNWDVYTAFHSKACVQTDTGITIRRQPKWLKPLNIFSQKFLLACAYAPCLITFTCLLLENDGALSSFTSMALSVCVIAAPASVICFRFGSAWEVGERVLIQIYGNEKSTD